MMMYKVLGTKKLMTQVFDETGEVLPVTVIDLNDAVVAKKSEEMSYIGIGKKKNATKAETGNFKDLGFVPRKVIQVKSDMVGEKKVGDKFGVDFLKDISKIDVEGMTKGKGFAGVVKRWNFAGGPKTHGQSDRHRAPGSIGSGTDPGRVWKGQKMGGRMGYDRVTIKNLRIVKIDEKNNLIYVKGAVPGSNNSVVILKVNK